MYGLPYGAVLENDVRVVLGCYLGQKPQLHTTSRVGTGETRNQHTYGAGGRFAGSHSCGIDAQVSIQCPPAMLGIVTSACFWRARHRPTQYVNAMNAICIPEMLLDHIAEDEPIFARVFSLRSTM